jgi:tetratricopeptide (TPR) repeat protein
MLAACSREAPPPVPASASLDANSVELNARVETLQDQLARYDSDLKDAQAEVVSLNRQLQAANDTKALDQANARITELEAEVVKLKAELKAAEPAPTPEPVEPKTEPAQPAPASAEDKQRLADLLPQVKEGTEAGVVSEYVELLSRVDKATRDDAIKVMQQWVKDEPENKQARLTLAMVLTTRFADFAREPMKQGALAGDIKTELDTALKIDPDYYDAVHFLAIMKVNYPSFTPEFKDAPTTLQRALELQKNLPWQERFAEIYAAWGMWHRVQGQLEDAAARVKQGLDQWPTDQGLLDEQARIAAAQEDQE